MNIDDYAETIPDTKASALLPLSKEIYEVLDKEDADLLLEYINADHGERKKIAERMGIKPTALYQRIQRFRNKILVHLTKE